MSDTAVDPYAVLGVAPDASDDELRHVYRELVKRHHPDHNGGSPESTARFAQIQSAYALIAERRRAPASEPAADPRAPMSEVDERIAAIEAELRRQTAAREAAARAEAAREAQAAATRRRPTPEELGYYTTEDSFTQIIDDATEQFAGRLRDSDAKRQFTQRLADLFGRGSR
jgi:curved DNA-binding protein CbpA